MNLREVSIDIIFLSLSYYVKSACITTIPTVITSFASFSLNYLLGYPTRPIYYQLFETVNKNKTVNWFISWLNPNNETVKWRTTHRVCKTLSVDY